ncbi:MAG: DUF2283 domain-containing protein [Nitrospinae bacterium]|nr:DUF2283 domain-containing protein [Nitrospinota bacterium]
MKDGIILLKEAKIIQTCLGLSSDIIKLPVEHIWIDYDKEADVLYLSFRKPQRAKKTIEADDDILVRKDGDKIVGITILNASNR